MFWGYFPNLSDQTLPWLPAIHPTGLLPETSLQGLVWHMSFVALLTLNHDIFLSFQLLLFILHHSLFHIVFYFTLTLGNWWQYMKSQFFILQIISGAVVLDPSLFTELLLSLETALHFNKVSSPLGLSPLKQLQLPRAAEELSRESRSFCGQWCWW